MTITIEQAQRAVMSFVENEIAKKATGVTRFGAYFVMGALQNKFPKVVSNILNTPIVAMMDFTDEHGHLKIDEIYQFARDAINKAGSIEMYGIIFNQSDIDKLYHLMQTA